MDELKKYNKEGLSLLLQQSKNSEERSRLLTEGVINQICSDFRLWINSRLNCNLTIGVENNQLECAILIARNLRCLCVEPQIAEILKNQNFCECGMNLCYQFTLGGSDVNHFEATPNCDGIKSLILTTYQILSNYCACGEDFASDYWINFIRLDAQRNVVICKYIQSNLSLAAFVASLYQCTHSPSPNYRRRLQILLTDRLLFSSLLLSVVEISSFKAHEKSTYISSTDNEKEKVIEWLYILLHLFIKRGEIITLLQLLANRNSTVDHSNPITYSPHHTEKSLSDSSSKSDINAISTKTTTITKITTNQSNIETQSYQYMRCNITSFSHEQLILLMLLQDYFEDTMNSQLLVSLLDTTLVTLVDLEDMNKLQLGVKSAPQELPSNADGTVGNGDDGSSSSSGGDSGGSNAIDPNGEREVDDKASTQLLQLLFYLSQHISAVISTTLPLVYSEGGGTPTPTPTPTSENHIPPSYCPDSLPLSLEVLGAALAVVPASRGVNLRTALTKMGLLTSVSLLLKHWGVTGLGERKDTTVNGSTRETTSSSPVGVVAEAEERRRHCVRASLRLIYNLLHGCPYAQDQLREVGGLATVLSNCTTDFSNPLAREWALLCVKHACELNELNQEFIRSLTPQDIIQDEILKSHGVKLEIDPSGGTFKFTQEIPK